MAFNQVGLLPLLCAVFALIGFFAGYGIALGNDHIDAWLPFISDCGTVVPERMVFGQFLSLSAASLFIVLYLNHRKTLTFYGEQSMAIGRWKNFARFMLFIGWMAAVGGLMVANFPESDQITVHSIGAFMFFILIILYFWGYLFIAYSLKPRIVPVQLTHFRLVLTFTVSLVLIFHIICLFAQPFVTRENGKFPTAPDWPHHIERPNSTSPFYTNHIAAAASEWAMAFLIFIGVLTLSYELGTTVYHAPRLSSKNLTEGTNSDAPIVYHKETRVTPYDGFAAYSSPYGQINQINSPDRYSETVSISRRLPRIDNYQTGTVYSTRSHVNGGTTYNGSSYQNGGYTHY